MIACWLEYETGTGGSRFLCKGFLKIHDHEFRLEIAIRDAPGFSAEVFCDMKLKELLKNHINNLPMKLKESKNAKEFMNYIEHLALAELKSKPEVNSSISLSCASVIQELETIGWNRLLHLNPSFDDIHLSCTDIRERQHVIRVKLHKQHPYMAPTIAHQLPVTFDPQWEKRSLKHIYTSFEKSIQDLQRFWDIMSDFDANFKVIEPIQPTLMDTHRRIAIETLVSIQVTVDPLNPHFLPDIKFFGSDNETRKLKESFYKNYLLWNPDESPTVNLKILFGIEMPKGGQTNAEADERTCSICLSFMADNEIPDVQCSSKCSQNYHPSCIVEWLKYQPGTRRSFKVLFGKCPNCKQSISVTT